MGKIDLNEWPLSGPCFVTLSVRLVGVSSRPFDRQFECHVVVVSGRFASCATAALEMPPIQPTELSKWLFSKVFQPLIHFDQ